MSSRNQRNLLSLSFKSILGALSLIRVFFSAMVMSSSAKIPPLGRNKILPIFVWVPVSLEVSGFVTGSGSSPLISTPVMIAPNNVFFTMWGVS